MEERNGIRVGQRVRDFDGKRLGRVTELYGDAFAVEKGLPILFRSDLVVRYDEVREIRGGEVVVARSSRDLAELARGELPPSWRVTASPAAATPSEAARIPRLSPARE